ncbi:MAG: FkbM family methyltransferase [Candidatus Acidiferrales bacterium]
MGVKSFVSESLLSHPKLWFFAKNALRSVKGNRDAEEALLPFLVHTNGIALDVGANRGIYTRILLARNRHVVSIEPNPDCARILERVFKNHVRVIAGAASNTNGEATLRVPARGDGLGTIESGNQFSDAFKTVTVKTFRIDDLGLENVTFMKVDVEGHEMSVLEGAMEILKRDRPTILLEAEERHHPGAVRSVRALLEPLNYEGFMLEHGTLGSIRRFDAAVHQSAETAKARSLDGHTPNAYINNFFFIPTA